jgi:drug/metabolite transporter (DMT)-like permease
LLGLISVPGNQFGYLYGLHHTTPANAALLYAMTPAFVVLAQKFILRQKVGLRRMIAVAVAFAGAVIILFESDVNFGQSYFLGNAIIFLAVIAWTAYTLLGRSFAINYGVIESTGLSMAAGTILALPLLLIFPHAIANSTLDIGTWTAILYLGVVTSLIGYSLWYYALKRIPASRVAVFTNIQPVLTTVVSVAFMGVTLTSSFVIGGSIVLIGVLLTQLW